MTELILKPCNNCGVKHESGKGWKHDPNCVDYDPPREMTFDDFLNLFGDRDPAEFI